MHVRVHVWLCMCGVCMSAHGVCVHMRERECVCVYACVRACMQHTRPVVLLGLTAGWRALSTWRSPAYLKHALQARREERHRCFAARDNLHFLAARRLVRVRHLTLSCALDCIF